MALTATVVRNPSAGSPAALFPNAQQQANALRSPAPATASTPVNPGQADALNRAKSYETGLATGTDAMIGRELGRARDEISVGMQKEGEGAILRGADPTLFRTRALDAGRRSLNDLTGKLTDVSLGRREGAVRAVTDAAGGAAGEQRMMHLGTMQQRLAEDIALRETAETQARLYQAPYDRLLQTMNSVGRNTSSFMGPTGYSPGLPGSGGSRGLPSVTTSISPIGRR